jgi:hypothetical protein
MTFEEQRIFGVRVFFAYDVSIYGSWFRLPETSISPNDWRFRVHDEPAGWEAPLRELVGLASPLSELLRSAFLSLSFW